MAGALHLVGDTIASPVRMFCRRVSILKNRDPLLTQHYVAKADHFFQAMKLLSDDTSAYGSSVALLAIHCSIYLSTTQSRWE